MPEGWVDGSGGGHDVGNTAADLEREEEASSAGLSALRGLGVVGIWRGIAYSENAPSAYCSL